LQKVTISFVMPVRPSVRSHGITRLSLDGFSWNLIIMYFSKKSIQKIQVSLKYDKKNGHFAWSPIYIFIISRLFLLRMRNISNVVEKIKTHFVFSNNFFFENPAVYEKTWKNNVQRGRPQMRTWRIRIAFWIPKATNTHSQYVILTAFPLQQRLHERVSTLRYTYNASFLTHSLLLSQTSRSVRTSHTIVMPI
jgi:hypothetical protein